MNAEVITYRMPSRPLVLIRSQPVSRWFWSCRHCAVARWGYRSQPDALAAGCHHLEEDHA